MALRNIVKEGDEALRKVCKPVTEITPRIIQLLDDMADTMYKADGVGLAAPQVGILRRIAVIDVGEGKIELINPEIIKKSDPYETEEGCLSLEGVRPTMRYENIEVEYYDFAWKKQKQKFYLKLWEE